MHYKIIDTDFIERPFLLSYLFLRAYFYTHTALTDDETEEEFVLTYK